MVEIAWRTIYEDTLELICDLSIFGGSARYSRLEYKIGWHHDKERFVPRIINIYPWDFCYFIVPKYIL